MIKTVYFLVFLVIFINNIYCSSIYWGTSIDGPDTYGTNPVTNKPYTTIPWPNELGIYDSWDLYVNHTNKNLSLVHWGFSFQPKSTPQSYLSNFDFNACNHVRKHGAISVMDWATAGWTNNEIASGAMDQYIINVGQSIKTNFPHPIFIRLNWEANIQAFDWGIGVNGNTADSYVRMWKRIHDLIEITANVTTITWVWCMNEINQADRLNTSMYNIRNFYPYGQNARGSDYVDWLSFDTYNWGNRGYFTWRTWDQVANLTYQELLTIAPNKPIMIGETACTDVNPPAGTSKALWITEQLSNLSIHYPQIKAFLYFNWNIFDGGMQQDWYIESSVQATQAFREGIASNYYMDNRFWTDSDIPVSSSGKIRPIPDTENDDNNDDNDNINTGFIININYTTLIMISTILILLNNFM